MRSHLAAKVSKFVCSCGERLTVARHGPFTKSRNGVLQALVHSISGVIWQALTAKDDPGGQHAASNAFAAAVTSK